MAETCQRCGEGLRGAVLPYNDKVCLKCHVTITEETWEKTGRLDIGLIGTAVLTQHPHWNKILSEFEILKKAISDFEVKIWTAGFSRRFSSEGPSACEATFGDISLSIWNSITQLGAFHLLDLKRKGTHLGLEVRDYSAPTRFVPYQINATLREACILLSDVAERYTPQNFKPVTV
jgi:hypothetical protein